MLTKLTRHVAFYYLIKKSNYENLIAKWKLYFKHETCTTD